MHSPLPTLARIGCLLALMLFAGCASRTAPVIPPAPTPEPPQVEEQQPQRSELVWQSFADKAKTAKIITGPFRINATLRYTDANGENTRVSSILWGNGNIKSPYPLRLDLQAGVGTVVAKAREDAKQFVVFSPDEEIAYVQAGGGRTLASFGVPVPLSLSDLTLLLNGQAGVLFIPPHKDGAPDVPQVHAEEADAVSYLVTGARLPGIVRLSEKTGGPLSWREASGKGWSITIEPSDKNPLQPQRLRIAHPKGYSALVVIKDRSRVSPPYTETQLGLILPPGTEQKPFPQ